jgi:hypothetical protein
MSESKFTPEEIERERRSQTKRTTNLDPEKVQAQRDFLAAAHTDTPEEFQARLLRQNVQANSDQWNRAMEAYWAIRRGR